MSSSKEPSSPEPADQSNDVTLKDTNESSQKPLNNALSDYMHLIDNLLSSKKPAVKSTEHKFWNTQPVPLNGLTIYLFIALVYLYTFK
jgi:hypothetical protein